MNLNRLVLIHFHYLFDRSKVTQNKINFVKNCPQSGLNSQPPDHQSHALPKFPTDSSLAQLAEHGTDDLEVVTIFDEIYFVLCNFRSVR